jgi:hypothetical protein
MGVPTSEVGYTSATTGRGVHEVHKGHVVAENILDVIQTANTNLQVFSVNALVVLMEYGHVVGQLVEVLRYKPEGRGINSQLWHWNFSLTKSFRPHCGIGVNSTSNINVYQEYFLGVKAVGAFGRQPYHLHVPIVLKCGASNCWNSQGL